MGIFACLCFLMCFVPCAPRQDKFALYNELQIVSENEFQKIMKTDHLTLAYFYQKDATEVMEFLNNYNEAGAVLKNYEINSLIIDCDRTPVEKYCVKDNIMKVVTFMKGEMLLTMEIENLFDLDSFLSNVLQLLMVDEIPVLTERAELLGFMKALKTKTNALFAYFQAIGGSEHRAFMELAYSYKDKINFTLSTESKLAHMFDLENEQWDGGAVWVLRCKDEKVQNADICPHSRMFDWVNIENINRFISSLTLPRKMLYRADSPSPYIQMNVHVMYIYYDSDMQKDVLEVVDELANLYNPSIGIILINTAVDVSKDNLTYTGALPALSLKLRNEAHPHFMEGEFRLDYINKYLRARLREMLNTLTPESPSDVEDNSVPSTYRDEVDRIEQDMSKDDSEVGVLAYEMRERHPDLSSLTAVTDLNYMSLIKDQNPFMVLYHLKFDARSQLLLGVFANVSKRADGKKLMGHVDCHNWKKVCDEFKIVRYPQILIHRKKIERTSKYEGRVDPTSLIEAVATLKKDTGVTLKDIKMVNEFIAGTHPGLEVRGPVNISVLVLVNTKAQENECRRASEDLQTIAVFGLVKEKLAEKVSKMRSFPLPGCVLFRHNDPHVPHVVYKGDKFTKASITAFVKKQRYPVFTELTVTTYPALMKVEKLLAVLFTTMKDHDSVEWFAVAKVAAKNDFAKKVVCTWMDVSNRTAIGARLLYTYTKAKKTPTLVVVSHKAAGVFVFDGPVFDYDPVRDWLKSVIKNKVQPLYNLSQEEWKPTHRSFDYLRMMDEGMSSGAGDVDDSLDDANEFGVDFENQVPEDELDFETGKPESMKTDKDKMPAHKDKMGKLDDKHAKVHKHDEDTAPESDMLHGEFDQMWRDMDSAIKDVDELVGTKATGTGDQESKRDKMKKHDGGEL